MAEDTSEDFGTQPIIGGLMGLKDPDLLMNVGLGLMSAAKYGGNVGDGLSQALGNYQKQKMMQQQIAINRVQMQRAQAMFPLQMEAMQKGLGALGGGQPQGGAAPMSGPAPPQGAMTPVSGPAAPQGAAPPTAQAPGLMSPASNPLQTAAAGAYFGLAGMPGVEGLQKYAELQLANDPQAILSREIAKNPITVGRAMMANAPDPQTAMASYIKFLKDAGQLEVSRNGVVTAIGGVPLDKLGVSNINPGAGTQLQNGQESVIPNAPQARATIAGAEEAGKQLNTPRVMPTAGGGSAFGYPPTPPALGGSTRAGGGAPAGGKPAPAVSQAPTGPWADIPKLRVPQGIGEADLYTTGRLKKAADIDAELSQKLGNSASLAEQQLEFNREAMNALPNAETGPLSNWLTHNRATLLELGVPANLIPSSGTVTPTLELNKALKNAALQGARQIYGPRMSQMEVKLQTEEMSPSPNMMRDAIASLVQQNNVRSLYAKQMGTDYGKYQEQGGDPSKFESWYASKFPLTKFAQANGGPAAAPSAASPKVQHSRAELEAEMRRRGFIK